MPPTLSLIVPVYNVEPYLPRCLDSLLAQDLTGLEILCVDDGSTDRCPALLAEYEARHGQHLRVIRQSNAGVSVARNTGLEHSRGEYLAFVDSDDWIEPDYYRRLLSLAQREELDLAHGDALYHYEGRAADRPIYGHDLPTTVMAGREVLRQRLRQKTMLHMIWPHLYRRRFIEKLGLRFVPGLLHEDVLWATTVFLHAQRTAYDPTPGYHYRQRLRPLPPQARDQRLSAVIASAVYNARSLDALACSLDDDPELQRLLRWQLTDGALSIFHKLGQMTDPELKRQLYRFLRHEGVFALLWRNATETCQKRRLARNWLKSWIV